MKLSSEGKLFIKNFEKCHLTAYENESGSCSIGYSWTGDIDGIAICEGMTITQEKAEELFNLKTHLLEKKVNNLVTIRLKQYQFDALMSFIFNIGVINFKGSMLLNKLNSGEKKAASDQFLFWHKDKGKTSSELIIRRAYERDFFLGYKNYCD